MNNQEQTNQYIFHIQADGEICPHRLVKGTAVPEIPPGVYTLVYDKDTGKVSLRPEDNFKLPQRLYGTVNTDIERFIQSFELNDKNLGILLAGRRGSGKTITLKALSVKVQEMGYPVILVNEVIPGPVLNWFASTIKQPVLFNFDEAEKTYSDEDEQKALLQLLDGVNTGAKKMFCFTVNEMGDLSNYLLDRPSRIRYVRQFDRMAVATVVDYVQTNLKNCTEENLHAFIHLALCDRGASDGMNFDSMCEYVREMNQFGGTLTEATNLMSALGTTSYSFFEVSVFEKGVFLQRSYGDGTHKGPYVGMEEQSIGFQMKVSSSAGEEKSVTMEDVMLTQEDFKHFGDSHDVLVYARGDHEYHLRYLTDNQHTKVATEVAKERAGKLKVLEGMVIPVRMAKTART